MFTKENTNEPMPDFKIVCPGGLTAEYVGRTGDTLRWRGFLPPASGSLAARVVEYEFSTDLQGTVLRD